MNGISGFLLIIGMLLPSGEVQRVPYVAPVYFDSLSLCQETANHGAVVSTYTKLVEPNELRIWCEPIQE